MNYALFKRQGTSVEAKQTLKFLKPEAEPPPFGRSFYHLTPNGIVRVTLPPRTFSPLAIGFKRVSTRGPRLYSPVDGSPLRRVRLWVAQEVTEQEADGWIKPYKVTKVSDLFEVDPTAYSLAIRSFKPLKFNRTPRKFVFDYLVVTRLGESLEENLDDVIKKMNSLLYQGVWKIVTLKTGERAIMFVRGKRPTIVLKPRSGVFFGLKEEKFDPEQVQQTAAIVLMMLAKHFREFVRYARTSTLLKSDELNRLLAARSNKERSA